MAAFSDGNRVTMLKKGSIKQADFHDFVHQLSLAPEDAVVLDNASIHHGPALAIGRLRCMELLGRARPAPFCRAR
jgi:hypothetical protein